MSVQLRESRLFELDFAYIDCVCSLACYVLLAARGFVLGWGPAAPNQAMHV